MFSFTVSVCMNKGLVSLMTELAQFYASVVVLFSMYNLLETHKHRYIFYSLKSENSCCLMMEMM